MAKLGALVQAAAREWDKDKVKQHQSVMANQRVQAADLQRDLAALRRTLLATVGRNDRDHQKLRAERAAAVQTAAELLRPMLQARRGHFLVLSSQADGLITPDAPSYAASKAALSSYFEALALAARPSGVRVTNLRFGFVDTNMAKAPVRPFLRSVDWAVDVVVRTLRENAIRVTRPRRLVPLVRLLRWITDWRIRFT